MEIALETYTPPPFGSKPNCLGRVKVILNNRMFVWMNVVKGKGRPFCKFSSIKSGEEYIPVMGWVEDDKMERKISDEVIRKLKERNEI